MKFSVLMSVYAKEKPCYLKQALQSLVDQSVQATEVVLVEDGPISFDLSNTINSFRHLLNINSVYLLKNSGLGVALNEGLQACSFDLVARMDTDDIAMPDRFQKQVKFVMEHPDISVSSGMIEEWNTDMSKIIHIRHLPMDHASIYKFAKSRCPISHPAVIYRKSIILSLGGYPDVYPEDYPLWSNLLLHGFKFANIPEVLVKMRTGDEFISRRGLEFLKGEIKIFEYQKKIGFINAFEFYRNVSQRIILRLSPVFIKRLLYRFAR